MDSKTKLKILGSGQDAGIPHTGCFCSVCNRARRQKRYQRLGPSIAVFNRDVGFCYLVDASPDFKHQTDMIRKQISHVKREGKIPVSGILLTHAHFGHSAGLWQLGKEVLSERDLPVFCTPSMKKFLSTSLPFKHLVQNKVIRLRETHPSVEFALNGFRVVPIEVPHRREITDAVGYIIKKAKRVIYIPDTDRWTDEIIEEIARSDIALIDGTFYSKGELANFEDVRHPPISETIHMLEGLETRIYFTHINHTNAINSRGPERRSVENKGFKIAYDGLTLEI
jgi:pyrroloquinoline quinone biosynthesis protein B